MVTILDNLTCPQGSEIWDAVRRPLATASNMNRILTPSTLKPSSQARKYAITCACALQGISTPAPPPTYAMERGLELEPLAAQYYTEETGNRIDHVGFVYPDERYQVDGTWGWGCSPDGLIGEDGVLEIKCPLEAETVVEYADDSVVPLKYKLQTQFLLWVTKRKWLDFLAFHPNFSFLCRTIPDSDTFAAFERHLPLFAAEVRRLSIMVNENKIDCAGVMA